MIAKDRKATLQAIHTMAVIGDVTSLRRNVALYDLPSLIHISEKEFTREEFTTLAQLRSGHCILLGSYKSIISKDVGLDACCGKAPHDVKHQLPSPSNDYDIFGLIFYSLHYWCFKRMKSSKSDDFDCLTSYYLNHGSTLLFD